MLLALPFVFSGLAVQPAPAEGAMALLQFYDAEGLALNGSNATRALAEEEALAQAALPLAAQGTQAAPAPAAQAAPVPAPQHQQRHPLAEVSPALVSPGAVGTRAAPVSEVYGWWDVDCGQLGQPVCKSFAGNRGWCWVSPHGAANRTILVPAPRPDGARVCERCGSLGLPACPTMNGTSFCYLEDEQTGARLLPSFYAADPAAGISICVACGGETQLACRLKGEARCDGAADVFDVVEGALPTCGPCGGDGEPACTASADGLRFCVDGGTVEGERCRSAPGAL